MLKFNQFRFHQVVLKRHKDSRLFYGIGYHFDVVSKIDDQQLDLTTTPSTTTHHYRYQTTQGLPLNKYSESGLSVNVTYDSRDNVAYPYSGRYANVSLRVSPEFLGSTSSLSRFRIEYRDYLILNKERPRHQLAFWTFAWFVSSGKAPYMLLPATGFDLFGRSARPYTQGRFRGEDLSYSEAEWRVPLQKTKNKWGAVVFANFTSASSRTENVKLFSTGQLGYGAGLRLMLSEKSRVNLGIDYGFGRNGTSGLFLNLNEYFKSNQLFL